MSLFYDVNVLGHVCKSLEPLGYGDIALFNKQPFGNKNLVCVNVPADDVFGQNVFAKWIGIFNPESACHLFPVEGKCVCV
jgi:hypothetical protein